MIERLLIANRGEIAVRVARAAREMKIAPLGIYSEADAGAYHLRFMNEAACVGPAPASESYLNVEAIIAAAKALRADAVHPGYGFLSERAAFANAVREAGLIFVGPPTTAIETMGSKIEAKRRVRERNVPTVPGYDGDDQTLARVRAEAERIGFPVLIKASAGGGGRGMRVVEKADHVEEALEAARREALAAFGSDAVLLEKYLVAPRHIEFQILADAHGNTIHLGERECSIQRRHQKIVEEAPSVALASGLRAEMGAAAVRAAQSVGYQNAGTCEFMLAESGYYFLEMNTRLQVEHPVTELVYGVDLVTWQLRVANGERLTIAQADVQPRGWAIETRIYAEDPANRLLPSTGTISTWAAPEGPGIRLDTGVAAGSAVSVYYDPILAKLIAHAPDRTSAIARLDGALKDFAIAGVRTNIPLLLWILRDTAFKAGVTTTHFLEERLDEGIFSKNDVPRETLALAAAGLLANGWAPWRIGSVGIPLRLQFADGTHVIRASYAGRDTWSLDGALAGTFVVNRQGDRTSVTFGDGATGRVVPDGAGFAVLRDGRYDGFSFASPPSLDAAVAVGGAAAAGGVRITAPMPGKIAKIVAREGDEVAPHALLVVLEAMKMEHRIEAPGPGTIASVLVREGDVVASGAPLLDFA